MPEQPEDQTTRRQPDLEAALRRLGEQVDAPPQPEYAPIIRQQLEQSGRPSRTPFGPARRLRLVRPLAAAVALLVVLAVILGVPATRQAVADLFGISGVRVRPLPTTGPSPRTTIDASLDLGDPVTLAEARRRVSFPVALPSTASLGAPDAVYVRDSPGLEAVNLVYRPRAGFPGGFDGHVGLLLSEYAGAAKPYFVKYIDQHIPLSQVIVAGRWPGLYFPGAQEVYVRDPGGLIHSERPRLSAPSLVWERGSVTYRLEADISRARALAIAASLR
ncbi:MAG: hypothetical protein ABJA86_01845 [Nocardioidaceae bacterium]